MTVIACTLIEMAGDSRITGDVIHHVEKVRRINGSVYGVAGDWDACCRFFEWIEKGGKKPDIASLAFEAMELTPEGIFLWSPTLTRYKTTSQFHAIGGGALGAKCLLSIGMSPVDAVAEVAKWCESVGGLTTCLKVNDADTTPIPRTRAASPRRIR